MKSEKEKRMRKREVKIENVCGGGGEIVYVCVYDKLCKKAFRMDSLILRRRRRRRRDATATRSEKLKKTEKF
jgi:hypothetical protein